MICGPMFSGKSEKLLERLAFARAESLPTAVFKHASDDRYDGRKIVTHNGRRIPATPIASAGQILELAGNARLIVIDEAQFFAEDLVSTCLRLAGQGRTVIVAALDLDSWGLPFGHVPELEAVADQVLHMQGRCSRCGRPSDHTQRLASIGETMIGGAEAYEPRCAACFVAPPMELRR